MNKLLGYIFGIGIICMVAYYLLCILYFVIVILINILG